MKQELLQKSQKIPNEQQHIHGETSTKEKRLRNLRATKFDNTTQVPGKDRRVQ